MYISEYGHFIRKVKNSFVVKEREYNTQYGECGILKKPFLFRFDRHPVDARTGCVLAGCDGLENREHDEIKNVEVAYTLGSALFLDESDKEISFKTESLMGRTGECGYPQDITELFSSARDNIFKVFPPLTQGIFDDVRIIFPGYMTTVTVKGMKPGTYDPLNFVALLFGRAKRDGPNAQNFPWQYAWQLMFSHYKVPKNLDILTPEKLADLSFKIFIENNI